MRQGEQQIFDFSDRRLYNDVYIPILKSKKRNVLIYGSRDSAKSDFVAGQCLKHLLVNKYARGVMIRKVFNSIKDSQYDTIKQVATRWGIEHFFKFNVSPLEITCLINGNKMLARGLDKPEKTKSIKDPTFVWYEEADELSLLDYIKTSQSVRGPKGSFFREYFTFNPEDEESYLNTIFFPESVESYQKDNGLFNYIRSKRDDTVILHTTFKDNRFCLEDRAEYHERLKTIDEDLYNIYSLGLWGNRREGLVFPRYNIIDELPDEYDYRMYGVDWGFSNDPKVLVEIRVRSNHLYMAELVYQTHLRIGDMIKIMKDLEVSEEDPIYCDTNDPEKTAELALAGYFAMPAYKPKNSIELGVQLCKHYIEHITEDSTNARYEYKNYRFKVVKGRITSTPVDLDNHFQDAKRYGVFTHSKLNNIKVGKMQ